MNIFVVDIDSTCADTQPRIQAIEEKYGISADDWEEKHYLEFLDPEAIKNDPIVKGAEIVPELARRCKAKLFFLTGRSEIARPKTKLWLENNLNIYDSVPLIMRPDGDHSVSANVKEKMFEKMILKLHPEATFTFFDDDVDLLKRYSRYGLALRAPDCWSVISFPSLEERLKNE